MDGTISCQVMIARIEPEVKLGYKLEFLLPILIEINADIICGMAMIHFFVNGEPRDSAASLTIRALCDQLELAGAVAIEHNREIVPRSYHSSTIIKDGDHLEIVQCVGGG